MANVADQFVAINAYFNGTSFWARLMNFTPRNDTGTETYRASGMDGSVALETGMEEMTTSLVLKGIKKDAIKEFGTRRYRRSVTGTRGTRRIRIPEDCHACGIQYDRTRDCIETENVQGRGEVPTLTINMSLNYYKYTHGGEDITEIDVLNMERVVDGTDRLEAIRDAIGA